MLRVLIAAAIAFSALPAVAAPSLLGDWEGVVSVDSARVRVVLHITPAEAGLPDAALDSPDQGAMDIPGKVKAQEGDKAEMVFFSVGGTYVTTISPDGRTLTGIWSQGNRDLPLVLTRRAIPTSPAG